MSSQSFENVTAKWTFFVQKLFFFFFQSGHYKKLREHATVAFLPFFSFLPPRSFLFALPFPSSV